MTTSNYPLMGLVVVEVSDDDGVTWTNVTGQLLSYGFDRSMEISGPAMNASPGTLTLEIKDTRGNVWLPSLLRTNQLIRLRAIWDPSLHRFTGRVDSSESAVSFVPGDTQPIITETVHISDAVKQLSNTPVKNLISQDPDQILAGTQVWYKALQQLLPLAPKGMTFRVPDRMTRTVYQLGERHNPGQQDVSEA